MDKYHSLHKYLLERKNIRCISLNFSQIEEIIGQKLPKSAYKVPQWWENSLSHSQAKSWLEADRYVSDIENVIRTQKVKFIEKKSIKRNLKSIPYDVYERQYNFLTETVLKNQENYEKTILTLSASFLAFSISFLGLFEINSINNISVLFCSWICFFTSVLMLLLNFKFSEVSINKEIDFVSDLMEGKKRIEYKNIWSCIVEILYIFAGLAFVFGISLLLYFCKFQYK